MHIRRSVKYVGKGAGIVSVIIKPLVSEKTVQEMENGKYYFKVSRDSNKVQIRQEVESIFGVKVKNVNTLNRKGKTKRHGKNIGKKPDCKQAIVELVEGHKIEEYNNMF